MVDGGDSCVRAMRGTYELFFFFYIAVRGSCFSISAGHCPTRESNLLSFFSFRYGYDARYFLIESRALLFCTLSHLHPHHHLTSTTCLQQLVSFFPILHLAFCTFLFCSSPRFHRLLHAFIHLTDVTRNN